MENPRPGSPVIFREEQSFRQWWINAVVMGTAGFAWYAFFQQIILHKPLGKKPAPDWGMFLVWLLAGVGLPWLFLTARLVVEVRGDGLYYRYYPFHFRWHHLAAEDIREVELRTYRPLLEYGGWGIRWGLKGKAYNVSGNRGVRLRLRNGKRLLFGSRRAEELPAALRGILPDSHSP